MSLKVGDDRPFQMELSVPPLWAGSGSDSWWRTTYQTGRVPVRLAVTCEKDGAGTWEIPLEVRPSLYEFPGAHV